MEELLLLTSICGNLLTIPTIAIQKTKNCSLDEAFKLEKTFIKNAFQEFATYVTGKEFLPVSIGLLSNLEFVNAIREDWKNLSAISIDTLGCREGFFTMQSKANVRGFQYLQFELVVSSTENIDYFLIALEHHIAQQLQILQYPKPLIHVFSMKVNGKENHVICSAYFSTNENEKQSLQKHINLRKKNEKINQMQKNGINDVIDSNLEKEFKDEQIK